MGSKSQYAPWFSGRNSKCQNLSLRSMAAMRETPSRIRRGFHKPPDELSRASAGVLHPRFLRGPCIECQGHGKIKAVRECRDKSVLLGSTAAAARWCFLRPALPGALAGPEKILGLCRCGVERVGAITAPWSSQGSAQLSKESVSDRASDRIANRLCTMSGQWGAVLDPWLFSMGPACGQGSSRVNRVGAPPRAFQARLLEPHDEVAFQCPEWRRRQPRPPLGKIIPPG